jgi:pimeloyl-ACP methyl ester carboxylesterase
MNYKARLFLTIFALSSLGFLLAILRYIARTPQPIESVLPGESSIYQWMYGNIFFKTSGATDKPPCVLIHDPTIGSSSYEMRHLVTQLAQHYHVYTLDLLGFGLSDHPKVAYSAEIYVSLCRDFLKQVVKQPAILIASGLSCTYCVTIAANNPELCSRLVLLSPQQNFTTRPKSAWLGQSVLHSWLGFLLYTVLTLRPALRLLIARQQHLAPQEVPANEIAVISAYAHQPGAHYTTLAYLAGKLQTQSLTALPSLKLPVLILSGQKTGVATQRTSTANIEVFSMRDAGTHVHEEVPTQVMAHLLSWLQVPEQAENAPQNSTSEAYCVKCKAKRTIQNARKITTKNGRSALEGSCPVCGTKLYRFIATTKE